MAAETAATTPGGEPGLDRCDENDLYAAMDGLVVRQDRIEQHLEEGCLVPPDLCMGPDFRLDGGTAQPACQARPPP
ncbi:MAG: hypothetical protein OXC91_06320 [Rhodobacteraceae bacterium]|nr:hypothetical protein [Paracoccaceae bacterium]